MDNKNDIQTGKEDLSDHLLLEIRALDALTKDKCFQAMIERIQTDIRSAEGSLLAVENLKQLIRTQTTVKVFEKVLTDLKRPVKEYQEMVNDSPLFNFLPVAFDDANFNVLIGDDVEAGTQPDL